MLIPLSIKVSSVQPVTQPHRSRFRHGVSWRFLLALLLSSTAFCVAQKAGTPKSVNTIRIWGVGRSNAGSMQTLLEGWEKGFARTHPDQHFESSLFGDDSAMGGLYTGVAEIAVMDREASFIEADAYQQATGFAVFGVPVAHGSVETPGSAPALVFYVHRDNPLTQLTIQQIDGIFDADHLNSARRYKTWGDLGLTGTWTGQPIHLYSYEVASPEMRFFERAALKGSQKQACCEQRFRPQKELSAEEQMSAAVARDRYGLALSTLPAPGLKRLSIASGNGGPAVFPTPRTITDGSYPLARSISLYIRRKPGDKVPDAIAEFLRYILSPAGQAIVSSTGGGYIPLSPRDATKSMEALR